MLRPVDPSSCFTPKANLAGHGKSSTVLTATRLRSSITASALEKSAVRWRLAIETSTPSLR
ncbi:hypothetical protein [Allokutzneria multivorans]|uniref:hypothetical protein n=1 Tax=Allokutzneria multivorans TaxID=1142134 RepID=UPI0031EA8505